MIKLNIGCWHNKLDGFINIDNDSEGWNVKPDIKADAKNLPFINNSIDFIYSGHLLEHFCPREIEGVLQEWKRVLKPGCRLELVFPDIIEAHGLYLRGWWTHAAFSEFMMGTKLEHKTILSVPIVEMYVSKVFGNVEHMETSMYMLNPHEKWQQVVGAVKLGV